MPDKVSPSSKPMVAVASSGRMLLIEALRAVASTVILWHHFALYGPLSDGARPVAGNLLWWLKSYGRATQVFFVVGGYVLARSLTRRRWDGQIVGRFVVARYIRLVGPYLGATALALGANALGRGWIPDQVLGDPPTWSQLLAHVALLQNILGYESVSAGLWFVCINFQLCLIFVALLYLRDWLPRRGERGTAGSDGVVLLLGWALAGASLFYFTRDNRWDMWALYFFGYFFLGVMVHYGLQSPRYAALFWLYMLMMAAAILYHANITNGNFMVMVRMTISLLTALTLFLCIKLGVVDRWTRGPVIAYMGRTSYSLFLVHYSVLVVVATMWTYNEWQGPWAAMAGLGTAYVASLVVADIFYRVVEIPAAKLSHKVMR